MQSIRLVALLALMTVAAGEACAMAYETIKMTLWKRGETIAGEEFMAANEAVVDYIATLKRPTDLWKGIRYQCQAKGRYIRPTVYYSGVNPNPSNPGYIDLRQVFELKDCVEAR